MSERLHTDLGAIRSHASRLDGSARDYDPLMELARERPLVLLGEATHGTHEFYRIRADITRRLSAISHRSSHMTRTEGQGRAGKDTSSSGR